MNPKVSIIVPVYNVEEYLDKCFSSILSQTLPEYEVLVINDGSKDNSGGVCDKWAEKDDRIQVYHKENGGVATARNIGIDKAKGEYLYFMDPDDWIEPTLLEDNYKAAKEKDFDIVIFGCRKESSQGNKQTVSETSLFNKTLNNQTEIIESLTGILDAGGRFSIWNKLFRKDFIMKHGLKYPLLKRGQDIHFTMQAFKSAENIRVNKGVYYVQIAFFSIAKFDPSTVEHHAMLFDTFLKLFPNWLDKNVNYRYVAKLFSLWFFHVIPNAVLLNDKLSKKEKKKYLASIFKNDIIKNYLNTVQLKRVNNKVAVAGIIVLKIKSPNLLYYITKTKFGVGKTGAKVFRYFYSK